MHVIHAVNVNDALPQGIRLVLALGKKISPRGMPTLEVPGPVATSYSRPRERVLMYPERDANPFFHFFEGLWMIDGRQDVEFLVRFNAKMADYSDDGETFHGAYGYRLREHFDRDQLEWAIQLLRHDSTTRQVVLQIWDVHMDLGVVSKDIPCNDLIFLKMREHHLNMTVCCRSNDILWGCYGANAVHFSMIQEYLAAKIGCHVGMYTQISDSFHAYTELDLWHKLKDLSVMQPYKEVTMNPYPLVSDADVFDQELERFLGDSMDELGLMFPEYTYKNTLFPQVAIPMWKAWHLYKNGRNIEQAIETLQQCEATDWRKACTEWMQRRMNKPAASER